MLNKTSDFAWPFYIAAIAIKSTNSRGQSTSRLFQVSLVKNRLSLWEIYLGINFERLIIAS